MNPAAARLVSGSLGTLGQECGMDVDEPTVTARPERPADLAPHDHAWRRMRVNREDEALVLGEYRCDLCAEIWSM
jgi:hypothetical protein